MQKRVRAILLIACSLAIAAVVYAELKKGYYTPEQLGTMRQAGEMEASPDATFQVSAYPAPAVDLVPGDGLQEVQIYCGTCHSTRYITMQPPLAPATWEAEVNKMNKTFGAAIAEDSTRKIILYLQSHYTPETRKQ
jgi:mono/diheme cytochrome c family protein